MRYVPLEIPSGVYHNGTEYQSRGRWYDASLVRWENNEMKPIGGWQQKGTTTLSGTARGIIQWSGSAIGAYVAIGLTGSGTTKLYVIRSDEDFVDISPTGGFLDQESTSTGPGYGWLDYGEGTYGTGRTVADFYNFSATFSLDVWGQYLVGVLFGDERIFEWQLDTATPAAFITGSPECLGLVTTQERFLFALGADGDGRKVRWCDQEDNTTWTATATNQAGSFILESEGPIMQGVKTRGQTFILTTTDVFTATYVGAPLVYSFDRVGRSNGIVSRRAAVATDSFVAWMGPRGFWVFDGYVRELPCDVEDYVYSDFNQDQQSKNFGWVNSQFNEIWWHYVSSSATEPDRYVSWNYKENHWAVGQLDALAACDRGVIRYLLMVHSDGKVYEHEVTGVSHGTSTPYATSGPIDLPDATSSYVTKLIPDEKTQGDVTVELLTKRYPNGAEQTYGPFQMSNPTSVRLNTRQLKMKVREQSVGDWRWGTPRIQVAPGGSR